MPEERYGLAPGVGLFRTRRGMALRQHPFGYEHRVDAALFDTLCDAAVAGVPLAGGELRDLHRRGYLAPYQPGPDPVYERLIDGHDAAHRWWLAMAPAWCRELHPMVLGAHATRKVHDLQLGQCPVLPETVLRRVWLAGDEPRRVLLIGDDDLQCLAFARRGHRVTVVDVDRALIGALGRMAAGLGLEVELVEHDLRDPLPEGLRGRFDLMYADPVSSEACLELFLCRGLACLAPGGRAVVAVAHPAERLLAELLRTLGVRVERYHRDFNRYFVPQQEVAGYVSDAYEVAPTARFSPTVGPDEEFVRRGLFEGEVSWALRTGYRLFVHDIDTRFAALRYVEQVVAELERDGTFEVLDRAYHQTFGWCLYTAIGTEGRFLTIGIDREEGHLEVTLAPYEQELARRLEGLLLGTFRGAHTKIETVRTRGRVEARVGPRAGGAPWDRGPGDRTG